jgi:hypothetical protein
VNFFLSFFVSFLFDYLQLGVKLQLPTHTQLGKNTIMCVVFLTSALSLLFDVSIFMFVSGSGDGSGGGGGTMLSMVHSFFFYPYSPLSLPPSLSLIFVVNLDEIFIYFYFKVT